MKDKFTKILNFLTDFSKAKSAHGAALAKIQAEKTTYSEAYTQTRIDQENQAWEGRRAEAHNKFLALLEETTAAIGAARSQFPGLADPRFQTALNLIQATGGKLPAETLAAIAAQFPGAGNYQNALALRAALETRGVQTVAFDQSLYDLSALESLKNYAFPVFHQGASLNQLSHQVSKFAGAEGVTDWPGMVEGDLMTAAFAAAGLPNPDKP